MNRRRQSLIILTLFVSSLGVLALMKLGVLTSSYELRSRLDQAQKSQQTEAVATTTVALKPFIMGDMSESTLTSDGKTLRRWPAASTLPSVLTDDRTAAQGRDVGKEQLAGLTVILDAGNGGTDKGAVMSGAGNVFEKDITLDMARYAAAALKARGATVVFTREDDRSLSTFAREAIATNQVLHQAVESLNNSGIDASKFSELSSLMGDIIRLNTDQTGVSGAGLFGSVGTLPNLRTLYDLQAQATGTILISFQVDTNANDASQRGLRVLTQTTAECQAYADAQAQGKDMLKEAPIYANWGDKARGELVTALQTKLVESVPDLGETNGTGRSDDQMALIRNNNLASALVVLGFGSNATDSALLRDPAVLQKLGEGVASAAGVYFTGK